MSGKHPLIDLLQAFSKQDLQTSLDLMCQTFVKDETSGEYRHEIRVKGLPEE